MRFKEINERYEQHLRYVKEYFSIHVDVPPNPLIAFRFKYQHTMCVLGWAKKLSERIKDVNTNALYIAVVFHGGYSEGKEFHAERGAKIF
ncbi:hypothetical protein [Petrotoga sp. 9PWA.NaAc.5.4]|uniref:hypothetical protein n=1 Tax=Petrotoga sp. 9PWA.NaAc.5.4 TaxID=1434328 RepID=UPI000CBA3E61|nr:hypothetical protein [Petrotoga sp. 9PWA.NaAc.5.4]PNR97188.1 hypothetical protein X924_00260 [Petrotoga sp. 9PWA.NaAc.5.4]